MKVHRIASAALTALVLLPAAAADAKSERVCAKPAAGTAACHSRVVTDAGGKPLATAGPSGYGPADLRSAYALTATGAPTQKIAIVDAYDTADGAERPQRLPLDLRAGARRPAPKVNQNGGTTPPRATPAGARRSRSTSTWRPRSARAARSCSSRPTRRVHRPGGGGEHRRPARRHRDLELLRRRRSSPRRPATTYANHYNHPGSRSRCPRATPATASSTRRRRPS